VGDGVAVGSVIGVGDGSVVGVIQSDEVCCAAVLPGVSVQIDAPVEADPAPPLGLVVPPVPALF
jgi:hypothetical protein